MVALELGGRVGLEERRRLGQVLGAAEARCRSLQVDDSALRLLPTEDDLVGLKADGYLQQVLVELREAQAGPDGEVAREALVILADLLDRPEGDS